MQMTSRMLKMSPAVCSAGLEFNHKHHEANLMHTDNAPQVGESEPLLSVERAAALAGLTVNTLNRYRSDGRGPAFLSMGGRIFYRRADIASWLAETDGMLDTAQAAGMLGFGEHHLRNLRAYGTGPRFIRLKGHRGRASVFYRPEDVIAWRDAR